MPRSVFSRWKISITSMLVRVSRLPVGSSASRIDGLLISDARDRDALLLAARQLVGMVVGALAQADRVQHFHRPLVALGRLQRRVGRRAAAARRCRAPWSRQQVEALEDEPDLLVADDGQLVLRHPRHVVAVEEVLAGRRLVEAPDDVHERRLAGARRAGHRHELARLDVEVHAAQRVDLDLADDVGLDEILDRDDGGHLGIRRVPLPPPWKLPRWWAAADCRVVAARLRRLARVPDDDAGDHFRARLQLAARSASVCVPSVMPRRSVNALQLLVAVVEPRRCRRSRRSAAARTAHRSSSRRRRSSPWRSPLWPRPSRRRASTRLRARRCPARALSSARASESARPATSSSGVRAGGRCDRHRSPPPAESAAAAIRRAPPPAKSPPPPPPPRRRRRRDCRGDARRRRRAPLHRRLRSRGCAGVAVPAAGRGAGAGCRRCGCRRCRGQSVPVVPAGRCPPAARPRHRRARPEARRAAASGSSAANISAVGRNRSAAFGTRSDVVPVARSRC